MSDDGSTPGDCHMELEKMELDEFNICVITWNSLSAFTKPPTSFFREKTMAARLLAEPLVHPGEGLRVLLSLFSSILPNVTLFIWQGETGLGCTNNEVVRKSC